MHRPDQGPIEDASETEEDVSYDRETLIHELGHYFGISEEELRKSRNGTGAVRLPGPGHTVKVRRRFGQHFLERAGPSAVDVAALGTED